MTRTSVIDEDQALYFNLLAEIGHTKHVGGVKATQRIIELMDPRAGDTLLDVGCGVGIAPVFLAEHYGCRVVGLDVMPRMVERAHERARRKGVSDRTDFRVANMHALPFENGAFAAAYAESVLTFSDRKVQVIDEMARVVRPGGYVAFNEAVWVNPPPEDKADFMARAAGMPDGILSHERWQEILNATVLREVVSEKHQLTFLEESKSQYGRISLSDYLRAIPGFFRAITRPAYREVFRTALGSTPPDYFNYVGYGVYGGRVG